VSGTDIFLSSSAGRRPFLPAPSANGGIIRFLPLFLLPGGIPYAERGKGAPVIGTSIIIPVLDNWELTENCLRSLHATLPPDECEIIVVDNASTDATPKACPALGRTLFGANFRYHRSERNMNFGPASNLGARSAAGNFLLFLNNDTRMLPGWYGPLIRDFAEYTGLAAAGPVLLYPAQGPFGDTVQHLGVFVSPLLQVNHLYEGIPAAADLTKKRRFFQIITAACMMIPAALFREHGGFDEGYANGFEDVDLCARLCSAGYRMTVNPKARVYHLCGRTPGRHAHEGQNFRRLLRTSMRFLVPDLHIHLAGDGLRLCLTEWLSMVPDMPVSLHHALAPFRASTEISLLLEKLNLHPLWYDGHMALANLLLQRGDAAEASAVLLPLVKSFPLPDALLLLYEAGRKLCDANMISLALDKLICFCCSSRVYRREAENLHAWCSQIGLDELAEQCSRRLETAADFRSRRLLPFLEKMRGIRPLPLTDQTYALRLELEDFPKQMKNGFVPSSIAKNAPAFSILMPVYNPKPEHLREAVDSVLAQTWPAWELCMADDASTAPEIKPLLQELAALDHRIHVTFRAENGHIAAATNTALDMAVYDRIALVDQDDLLPPEALQTVAEAIARRPDGLLFYSDEDKAADDGDFFSPHFKNEKWDWELLYGQNFVSHLGVYSADRLREIGGFRDGFRGSQDFDMLLRYTSGIDSDKIVHIPKVLYHWRAHAGSTAAGVEVKGEAVESSRKALQAHVGSRFPGASVQRIPNSQYIRVQFPLPKKRPAVSLIIDFEEDIHLLRSQISALASKTAYEKYEIALLYAESSPERHIVKAQYFTSAQKNINLLSYAEGTPPVVRWNKAAQQANGQIVGFLAKGAVPLTTAWLEEMVSDLCREQVGCVGGKLLNKDKTLLHGGYLVDATGGLSPVLCGLSYGYPGYFAWARLRRTVDALDGLCVFTHSRLIDRLGGFDPSMPNTAIHDYCLRLATTGLRTVWSPCAELLLSADCALPWLSEGYVAEDNFSVHRHGKIAPFNPNLAAVSGVWSLVWPDKRITHNG
jgi:GT2 family glycosyltransferase